jgi:hypothetical protein
MAVFRAHRAPRIVYVLTTAGALGLYACGGDDNGGPRGTKDASADRSSERDARADRSEEPQDAGRDVTADASADRSSEQDAPGDRSEPQDAARDVSADAADASIDVIEELPPCPVAPDASFTAKLRVTADDYISIWFNGEFVAAPTSLWGTLKEYDVHVFLYPGRPNVIAVAARNEWKQNGYDRGAIVELEYTVADTSRFVNSDESWKVSPEVQDGGTAWTALDFDDSAWANAVSLGASGIQPWGPIVFNTTAEWIWSYVPNQPAADKVDRETILLRKVFYMDESGVASSDAGRCR